MDHKKKDFRKLYEDLVKSDWFKKAYHDKSLGECPFEIPELAETEDEMTRKWLYDYFSSIDKAWIHRDITCVQILSWLEKQKNTGFEIKVLKDALAKQPVFTPATEEDEKIRGWLLSQLQERVSHAEVCSDEIKMLDKAIDYLTKQGGHWSSDLPPGFYFVDLDGNRYYSKEFRYKDMKIKVTDCDQESDVTDKPRINGEPISAENQAVNIGDNETEAQKAYREGKSAGRKEVLDHPEEYGLEKIDNVFGFKIGDKVRLRDGDGRTHVIKAFEKIEGIHGPDFYRVMFEDNSARDSICPGEEYPNGYYTCMEKVTEWSAEDEQMKANILNALTPHLVYTVGRSTTTGTSTYRYDKEIAWFKALCLKQGQKDKD